MRKKFIILEGINGAGKSTLCQRLSQDLSAPLIKFPTPDITFRKGTPKWLSYLEDMQPKMKAAAEDPDHDIFIVDRSFISTAVYEEDDTLVDQILTMGATSVLQPDTSVLIIHVCCPPHVALERLQGRPHAPEKDVFGGLHNVAARTKALDALEALTEDSYKFVQVIDRFMRSFEIQEIMWSRDPFYDCLAYNSTLLNHEDFFDRIKQFVSK